MMSRGDWSSPLLPLLWLLASLNLAQGEYMLTHRFGPTLVIAYSRLQKAMQKILFASERFTKNELSEQL